MAGLCPLQFGRPALGINGLGVSYLAWVEVQRAATPISVDWALNHSSCSKVIQAFNGWSSVDREKVSMMARERGRGERVARMPHKDDPGRMTTSLGAGPRKEKEHSEGHRG